MTPELITKIIAPQVTFEGIRNIEKFSKIFCDLYRIELFKDGLDLILTKLQEKHLSFEVKNTKGWDTNVGCFLTEPKSFFNKTFGKVIHKNSLKIILRNLSCNVMAHEMAHALEFESRINLGEEFRQAIGHDIKNREPQILTLKSEIKRLMIDAIKSYKPEHFLSELFARYFELLSTSRNVMMFGSFATNDVMHFFVNTTNFIENIFNPQIRSKVNLNIAASTSHFINKIKHLNLEENFQKNTESRKEKNSNSWSKGIKSNASWQQEFKLIDDSKNS
jgi:hypothetical protein